MVGFLFGTGYKNAEITDRWLILSQYPLVCPFHIRMVDNHVCVKGFCGTFVLWNNRFQGKMSSEKLYIYLSMLWFCTNCTIDYAFELL